MSRGRRNASNGAQNIITGEACSCGKRLATGQLGKRRSTGDGGDAAFRLEANLGDDFAGQSGRELQYVSAGGVFELDGRAWFGQESDVARVLEMIEELGRVHRDIVGGFRRRR